MRKFLAVVKREYIQRVRTKFFVVATILGPVLMAGFTIVPAMMFSIKSGGPTRLAIVDQTGKMYDRVAKELVTGKEAKTNVATMKPPSQPGGPKSPREQVDEAGQSVKPSFEIEQARLDNRSIDDVRKDLEAKVQNRNLEGYIVLPPNLLKGGQPEFRARNTADLFTKGNVESAISRAVRGQRLVEAGIDEKTVAQASEPVDLKTVEAGGKESKGEASFFFVFGIGLLIYMSVLLYGQFVLGAVIEEKETRIAEILFSSMRSFPLMMGKLVGVSLVALTQLGIWAVAFLVFSLWAAGGSSITLPHIPPMLFLYFTVFFLMGYFIYSTVYAVVGSMVTTTQEGGQLALPVVLMLVAGFYLSFNIIRSPSSPLAFWASMFPFFAPITMLVRIVTETPPLWQILLSLGIGIATIVGLIWLASRIYRVGMLMYGKKATIPEVWRWVRQS
ncbi:MAG: type transport system permease protein [Blastocatellia bacterium]|jgi:ABC-2 type transport system permease protein|nr:type transport system permease protein [Blastocatellia bacterium]